jgi:hypothetical protein
MFKLNIECTKDINELHINFADGTSVISSSKHNDMASTPRVPRESKPKESTPRPTGRREELLDLDADFGGVSQDVVKPPDIQMQQRPVKVATELQNLDF